MTWNTLEAVGRDESTQRDLVEAADALLAEVEHWTSDDWRTACEVHGESSDAMHLVLHIASRCRHVTGIVRDQSESRLVDTDMHFQMDPARPEAAEATAALKQARDYALEVVRHLDERDIQRLHEAEIDGEPDVLLASCGLIGHWRFHLQTVRQIRVDA
jgi:hypothetical protein